MSTLFVIDIDGCIADFGKRLKEAGPEPHRDDREAYRKWVSNVQNEDTLLNDKPVPGMRALLNSLETLYLNNDLVYLTGREEQWRKITDTWLFENHFPEFGLIMRPDDDYSETHEFKEAAIDDLLVNFRPSAVVVIDDDQSGELEKVCARRGWTFLKAMSGSGK